MLFRLLIILSFCSGFSVIASGDSAAQSRNWAEFVHHDRRTNRRLVAARSNVGSLKRDDSLKLFPRNHVLHFLEESSRNVVPQNPSKPYSQQPLAAQIHLASNLPTMLLEVWDENLEEVDCSGDAINLKFLDLTVLLLLHDEYHSHGGIIIVTSHNGCNEPGGRQPYRVLEISRIEQTISLFVRSVSWKEAFNKIDIQFGSHSQDTSTVELKPILKRQDNPSSAPTFSSASPSIEFPSVTASSSSAPTSTNVQAFNIQHSWQDTTILPPGFRGADLASLAVPNLPAGLNVKCEDCSIDGSIDIMRGVLNVNSGDSGSADPTIVDFIHDGFVELTVNGFSAHIGLSSTIAASQTLAKYTARFPDISIPGFSIPGLAVVGPVLRPLITFGVEVGTDIEFTYGFNLSVPNNSTVFLNIGEPLNSTVSGFQNTQFNILPFSAKLDNVHLTASIAFEPQLLATIAFFENTASVNAGTFLNLPHLSAEVAQVQHVDELCNASNETDSDKEKQLKKEGKLYDSLINIKPAIDFNVGVLADAELIATKSQMFTAFSTQKDMPTACFSFDAKHLTYATPTTSGTPPSGTASGSGSGSGHKGAAAGLRTMFKGCCWWIWGLFGVASWMVILL